jgi:hypothetical protein
MREQRCNAATKPPSRQGRQRDCWYLYDVIFGGKVIVADSADPETDLARALMAQGIVGAVEIFDGRTGKPRSRVNIEAASKVTFREDRRRGPHRQACRPFAPEHACVPATRQKLWESTSGTVSHYEQGRNHLPVAHRGLAADL